MAILENGLETAPLNATAWRIVYNNNLPLLFTKTEVTASIAAAIAPLANEINALKDVPSNPQASAYTLTLTDRGKSIDTTANVMIPLASAVAFPVGSTISITNLSVASISILATSGVTLRVAGTADTGDCTLALYGMATLRKIATNTWYISGAGVALAEV